MPVKAASEEEQTQFPFEQKSIEVGGRKFTFRELSVQENDDCADSAKDENKRIDGRAMMRLMIIASSVDPKLTPKALAAMPTRLYGKIYDLVTELNNPDTLTSGVNVEDEEGNG